MVEKKAERNSVEDDRIQLSTRLEPELALKFTEYAKRNRRSVSAELAAAAEAWLPPQEVGHDQ